MAEFSIDRFVDSYAVRTAGMTASEVRALFAAEIERLNADLAQFEKVKKFDLLARDLSQDAGELTPTLKVKRRVVTQKFSDTIDRLYASGAAAAGA